MKRKIIIIFLIIASFIIFISNNHKENTINNISVILETSEGNKSAQQFPSKEDYDYKEIECKNLNVNTTTMPSFDPDTWKLNINLKNNGKIDGQFNCIIYFKENKETSNSCFAFDSSTGTITDYYDYEGGTSSGTPCSRDVKIPATIDNTKVTTIGTSAFSNKKLTSIILPNNIKTIETSAFRLNNLTSVRIPNSVTNIGETAFAKNEISSLTIPSSVTSIGGGAFTKNQLSDENAFIYKRKTDGSEDKTVTVSYGGKKRSGIIIPEGVEEIGDKTFYENDIGSVTIPEGVRIIGSRAFYTNVLSSIKLPDSLEKIGSSAFWGNRLTTVTIPSNVSTIETSGFIVNKPYSNPNLITIINKTGRAFDWLAILGTGKTSTPAVTGTYTTPAGKTLTVSEA